MGIESSINVIIAILANTMSEEEIIERLESDISDYKEAALLNKSAKEKTDIFKKISMTCMITLQKSTGRSIEQTVTSFDDFMKVQTLVKKDPQ